MNKFIRTVLAGTAMLAAVSCSDKFFEQYPANTITEGNHYQTDDDFDQSVKCCYLKLKTNMSFLLHDLAYRSDECGLDQMAVSTQDRYDIDHFQDVPNNSILHDVWGCMVQRHLQVQRRARPHGGQGTSERGQIPR